VSGHYHVQGNDGFVMYAGTPYQLNWGDYQTQRGFFVFEGADYEYIENIQSAKYIKIKYDSTAMSLIEVSGLGEEAIFVNDVAEFKELGIDLTQHKVKFFINHSDDKNYESAIFCLHEMGVEMDIINNVEISDLIGTDFVGEIDNVGGTELILRSAKDTKPHLVPLLNEILQEIQQD